MKKISLVFIAFIRYVVTLVLSVAALAVVLTVFWTQIKSWFTAIGFAGVDTPHYIHFVLYYIKNPHFPVTAWDYFWHNGVPRMVDLAWLHYTVASYLTGFWGVYEVLKIYPIVFLAVGAIFAYLIFYDLSKSVIISTALSISFVLSEGYYIALIQGGVVLSAISQMFFPAQLYFLIRFVKGGSWRNLVFGAFFSALGLYSHGLMMMFFGFIPACLFLVFADRKGERLITRQTIIQTAIFAVLTLTIGAMAVWPNLALAKAGGSTTTFIQHFTARDPTNMQNLSKLTNTGIGYGFILAFVIFLLFWVIGKRRLPKPIIPLTALNIWILLWMLSYTYTGNPLYEVLFPGRLFWIWPLLSGALAAALLSPLSVDVRASKWVFKFFKIVSFNAVKLVVFAAIMFGVVGIFVSIDDFKLKAKPLEKWERIDFPKSTTERHKEILEIVDKDKSNVRFWTHDNNINLDWIPISNMPLSEGYGHVWTYYSRLWEGWFYGTMSEPNWISNEIPREMAKPQSLFFLDWYGIKYMAAKKGSGEFDAAAHFYDEKVPYVERTKTFDDGRSVFAVSDDYTSPLISAVSVPVVGFVGNDESYMTFLKDIAMLNLNTSYLIPVKLSTSVGGIDSLRLANMDMLVLYDFDEGGFLFMNGWGKISDFVKNGGKVWIESGGNSSLREKGGLPDILPIQESRYGALGTDWQPGGEFSGKIDFSKLEKLVYRDTPWQVSYTSPDKVKSGARVLLTQKDSPVAVIQDVEKGRILWTGGNFWYRPEEYRKKGMQEITIVRLFLDELTGGLTSKRVQAEVQRPEPEKVTVSGQGFSGVAFKENHWPGWDARVVSSGKEKSVPIFTAGPELMYIPVPKDMRGGEIKVMATYKGAFFYWLCFFVSATAAFFALLYLILGNALFKLLKPLGQTMVGHLGGFRKKTSSWWDKDEEE